MKIAIGLMVAFVCAGTWAAGQEEKPVPRNSVRVSIPGCTKGYVFTASRRTEEEPGSTDIPEGMHIRMNGPKKMMAEIKAHEGSRIVITGLMRKGEIDPRGVSLGGGIHIGPGSAPTAGGMGAGPGGGQVQIDLEGWRQALGNCP